MPSVLNSSLLRAATLLLGLGATTAGAYTLETCADYHCDALVPVTLSSAEWNQVKALFRNVGSAEEERQRIADAIGLLEHFVGPKNGTHVDRGKNPSDVIPKGQLDCIAESTNSTAYLEQLQSLGLLKWHKAEERVVRHRWLFATHWTAVITDRDGKRYAVDSWYGDNGDPAIVLPLEAWYKGEER